MFLRHDAFPAVLANYPNRICPECDGYLASRDCKEIGRRYLLETLDGQTYTLAVADCANPNVIPTSLNKHNAWGDVSENVWKKAGFWSAPTRARLCTIPAREPTAP